MEMIKPFTRPEENIEVNIEKKDAVHKEEQPKLIKPFTRVETQSTKLYLVLKYYDEKDLDGEEIRDFEFFEGTSQDLYDYLKAEIEADSDTQLDVMRSRILVDSPKISISHKCSVYMFMKDLRNRGVVLDNTSFDIEDYFYSFEIEEKGE